MSKSQPIPGHDAPGLRIRTERGWELVGGPLAPAPVHRKWWNFPAADGYEAMFRGSEVRKQSRPQRRTKRQ